MAQLAANLAASSAVLLREAQRSARRSSTWWARIAYTLLLLFVIGQYWSDTVQVARDPSHLSLMGRKLFESFAGVQWTLVGFAAPLLVGLGMIEEREDGTLELLALTRLTTTQIVGGKMLSRILTLGTLVLAGLPVIGLISTFGGVSLVEALGVALGTLSLLVSLGAVGGWAGLHFNNGVLCVMMALGWGFANLLCFPGLFNALAQRHGGHASWLTPLAVLEAEDWYALLHVPALLPSVLLLAAVSMPVFRMTVGERAGSDEELLSPEIYRLERLERLGYSLPGLFVVLVVVPFGLNSLRRIDVISRWTEGLLQLSFAWLWMVLGQLAFTAAMITVTHSVVRYRRGQAELRNLALEAAEVAREIGYVPRTGLRRGLGSDGTIRGNPVAWREMWTGAHGATRSVALIGLVIWLGLLAMTLATTGEIEEDFAVLMGSMAVFGGTVLSVFAASASFLDERRRRSLPILLQTSFPPWQVVTGKVRAIFGLTSVWLVPGWALVGWAVVLHVQPKGRSAYAVGGSVGRRVAESDMAALAYCDENLILAGSLPAKLAFATAWGLGHWLLLVVVCLIVACRVRPARLGWGLNMGVAFAWVAVPIYVADGLDLKPLTETWWPVVGELLWKPECGLEPRSFAGLILSWGLAWVGGAFLANKLREWGTH